MAYTTNPYSISYICQKLNDGEIDLNTTWQRDIVWNSEKQELVIDSIMEGYHIPELVFSKEKRGDHIIWQSLDGKQRSISFQKYKNNELKWNNTYYNELTAEEKDKFDSTEIACAIYSIGLSEDKKIDIFNRIQKGMVLSHGEIIKSKTTSNIRNYLFDKIENVDEDNIFNILRENLQISRDNRIVKRHTWLLWLIGLYADYLNSLDDDNINVEMKFISTSSTKLIKFIEQHDDILNTELKYGFEDKITELNTIIININNEVPNFFKQNQGYQNILPIFHYLCSLDSDYTLGDIIEQWTTFYEYISKNKYESFHIDLEYIINKWQQYKRKNISPGTIKEMQTIFNNYCEYYNRA